MDRTLRKRRYDSIRERDTGYWVLPCFQETNLSTLLTILGSTKSSEVSSVVKGLSQDAQDTLMKYLYKGMATSARSDANSSVLLSWHEKVRHSVIPFTSSPI